MHTVSRLKKLETYAKERNEVWAVFTISCYEDPKEREKAQARLVDECVVKGNPYPTHRIFLNELPYPSSDYQEEKFLYCF